MDNDWERSIDRLVAERSQARHAASEAITAKSARLAENAKAFDDAVTAAWEPVLLAAKRLVEKVATVDIIDKSASSSNGTRVSRTYGLNVRALPLPGSTDSPPVAMLRFAGDFDTGLVKVEHPSAPPGAPAVPLASIAKDTAERAVIEVVEKALKG